jgi:serine/threonine-protein kinase RsbW
VAKAHHHRLHADEQEVFAALEQLVAVAAGWGVAAEQQDFLRLALEELLLNICHHSGLGADAEIDVGLFCFDALLRLQIQDPGPEFDPFAQAAPDLDVPIEEREIGGLGIHFVRSTSSRCDWRREGGRNVVEVDWALPS